MAFLTSDTILGPIKEQHKLMINPQPEKLILLLKYPTRQPGELYCDDIGNKPIELRIKPKCGLVEVDVPLDVHHYFDREKGLNFGAALRKKAFNGDSGSFYSVSSGFDPSISRRDNDNPILEDPSHDDMLDNFDDANSRGFIMNKITLGGRIEPFKDGDPIYMLATFEKVMFLFISMDISANTETCIDICTWTPLNGMVMLRPQFEHLDALRVQQKFGSRSTRPDDDEKKESKAEDINMTVKDTEDDEPQDDLYGGMAETLKILRAMADEPWQRLQWIDSEDDRAHGIWEDTLVYKNADDAPQLVSGMSQEQYLETISCPRVDPIHKGRNIMRPLDADPDDFGLTTDEERGPAMSRPKNANTRYLVEGTCREICGKPSEDHEAFVKILKNSLQNSKDYAFLKKSHRLHLFFLWRLRRNKAKRGWNLKMLRQKKEEENLKRLVPDEVENSSSRIADLSKSDGEEIVLAEKAPMTPTEILRNPRKDERRFRGQRKGMGEVELAKPWPVGPEPYEGDFNDRILGTVPAKDATGGLRVGDGVRRGRSATKGKGGGERP